jgi:aryl sulfotransferase
MALPTKSIEMKSHHFDSTKWDNFPLRKDDIVIATAYKSGTTWMQNIVLKLVYQGRQLPADPANMCPWLDLRVPPIEVQLPLLESITDRRQIKTHLRLDAIPYNPNVKYIYIGRDGRDCFMSFVNHYRQGNALWYSLLNESPGLVGDPLPHFDPAKSENDLFDDWISKGWPSLPTETDGYPFWSLFDNVRTWWEFRHLPNIHFVHFQDMLDDLSGSVREIAAFLDIPLDEENFPALVQSLQFSSMKVECGDPTKTLVPLGGAIFEGGAQAFINKVKLHMCVHVNAVMRWRAVVCSD